MNNRLHAASAKAAQASEMLRASVAQFEHFLTLFLEANSAYIKELQDAAKSSGDSHLDPEVGGSEGGSPSAAASARPASALHDKLKACEAKISELESSLAGNMLAGEAARFARHQLASLRGSRNKLLKRINAEGQSAGGAKWKPRLNK